MFAVRSKELVMFAMFIYLEDEGKCSWPKLYNINFFPT